MAHKLPLPVEQEAALLLRVLNRGGYSPVASAYCPESFGNWLIDFTGPSDGLRLLKDRNSFSFEGERSVLESANLWQFATAALEDLTLRVEIALSNGKMSA